jgi:hypothetical protein
MTLPHIEFGMYKKLLFPQYRKYSSLYPPPIVKQPGGSNLGVRRRTPLIWGVRCRTPLPYSLRRKGGKEERKEEKEEKKGRKRRVKGRKGEKKGRKRKWKEGKREYGDSVGGVGRFFFQSPEVGIRRYETEKELRGVGRRGAGG